MGTLRRAGLAAALAAAPLGLAYRFALAYRVRAGYPRRNPPLIDAGGPGPAVRADGRRVRRRLALPAWFIPARGGRPGPGVVLVHGWESARDRTLPMAVFLHAAGFHCLTFDVRGHGANPRRGRCRSARGEFGHDALAAFRALLARPEVTVGAISGHSMGAIGAILAAAADPRVAALVATSESGRPVPADPPDLPARPSADPRPDRLPARLADDAGLPPPARPRRRGGQRIGRASPGTRARCCWPTAPRTPSCPGRPPRPAGGRGRARSRAGDPDAAPVETLVVAGGQHSWLYEDPGYRRAVARLLTVACGGPLDPDAAGGRSPPRRTAERIPDAETRFAAMEDEPGGFRTLARVALPGSDARPDAPETPVDTGDAGPRRPCAEP